MTVEIGYGASNPEIIFFERQIRWLSRVKLIIYQNTFRERAANAERSSEIVYWVIFVLYII